MTISRHRIFYCIFDPADKKIYKQYAMIRGSDVEWTDRVMNARHFLDKKSAIEEAHFISEITGKYLIIRDFDVVEPLMMP